MDRRHQPECLSIHPRKKIYIEKRYSIPKYGISIRQSICSFLLQINQPAFLGSIRICSSAFHSQDGWKSGIAGATIRTDLGDNPSFFHLYQMNRLRVIWIIAQWQQNLISLLINGYFYLILSALTGTSGSQKPVIRHRLFQIHPKVSTPDADRTPLLLSSRMAHRHTILHTQPFVSTPVKHIPHQSKRNTGRFYQPVGRCHLIIQEALAKPDLYWYMERTQHTGWPVPGKSLYSNADL